MMLYELYAQQKAEHERKETTMNNEDLIVMLANSLKDRLKESHITIECEPLNFKYMLFVHFDKFNLHFKYTLNQDIFNRRDYEQVQFKLLQFIQEDVLKYFIKPWD